MADQVELSLPKTVFNESTGFTATVRFRDRATATASTPTTAEYKLYNLDTCNVVKDWTTLTPAGEISIAVSALDNVIDDDNNDSERIEFLVAADRDLSTQVVETAVYRLINLKSIS